MQTNDDYYFKNNATQELEEEYGDLISKITDKTYTIFREIEDEIFKYKEEINEMNDILTELDIYLSFYMVAKNYNFIKPMLVLKN